MGARRNQNNAHPGQILNYPFSNQEKTLSPAAFSHAVISYHSHALEHESGRIFHLFCKTGAVCRGAIAGTLGFFCAHKINPVLHLNLLCARAGSEVIGRTVFTCHNTPFSCYGLKSAGACNSLQRYESVLLVNPSNRRTIRISDLHARMRGPDSR